MTTHFSTAPGDRSAEADAHPPPVNFREVHLLKVHRSTVGHLDSWLATFANHFVAIANVGDIFGDDHSFGHDHVLCQGDGALGETKQAEEEE